VARTLLSEAFDLGVALVLALAIGPQLRLYPLLLILFLICPTFDIVPSGGRPMKTQAASRLLNALLLLLSFTVSANAAETILYDFSGGSDGDAPGGGLIHGPDGSFFGTAAGGGANGLGVVYQFLPPSQPGGAWTETVLYSFQGGNDG
jgi:hypothetical protein